MKSKPRSSFTATILSAVAVVSVSTLAILCSPCGAEGLDPMSASTLAVIATQEPRQGEKLTQQQEKYLILRQAIMEHALEEGQASWRPYEHILGKGRCRELDRALFKYNLYSPAYGHDLWQNPYAMDDMADTVLSAYAKIQREHLENLLGIDEWLDSKRPSRQSGPERGTSYRLRVSPRLSSNYLGVKFRMPHTELGFMDYLSFRVRYDFEEARPIYQLKFDDQIRFLNFSYEPNTRQRGDLMSLSLRFVW